MVTSCKAYQSVADSLRVRSSLNRPIARSNLPASHAASNYIFHQYTAGYINDTTAIDEIQFKMSSGNFDGVIQLFGIS